MSWIRGEFVIDSISQQSLAKARAEIVDRVRHNTDLEEFSNMGEDIGNITPIYPPVSCCNSLQSVEEWYEKVMQLFTDHIRNIFLFSIRTVCRTISGC